MHRARLPLLATVAFAAALAWGGPGHAQTGDSPFPVPAELLRPVTFAWTGSLDGAVRDLAGRIGYGFASVGMLGGPPPAGAERIEVSVSLVNTPAVDVAQRLGNQSGGRAVVLVDPERRELRVYHMVPGLTLRSPQQAGPAAPP